MNITALDTFVEFHRKITESDGAGGQTEVKSGSGITLVESGWFNVEEDQVDERIEFSKVDSVVTYTLIGRDIPDLTTSMTALWDGTVREILSITRLPKKSQIKIRCSEVKSNA